MPDDPYAVLGVEPGTDLADIRRAYLAQLRRNHPDVRPGDAAAEERTRALNWAWSQVRDRRPAGARPAVARPPTATARGVAARRQASTQRQRAFRAAFTRATLRIALALMAFGLVLLALAAS